MGYSFTDKRAYISVVEAVNLGLLLWVIPSLINLNISQYLNLLTLVCCYGLFLP